MRPNIAVHIALCLGLAGCGPQNGLKVSVTDPVHPVLIRNPQNVLLQVTLDSAAGGKLTSMEFATEGSTDLGDLDNFEVFATGAKTQFAAETRFGGEAPPAQTISFRGEQPLQPGANIFWLSCRLKPTADLSHKVSARLLTVNGAATPPPAAPTRPKRIGIALRRHMDDNVHTYRIPALATSPKGTLLSVYDMRRRKSRDLQEDIDIGLSRSRDGGKSWEPVKVIMDMGTYNGKPQEENGVSDPGIVTDPKTGEIFVFAVWMWGKPGKHQWNDDGSEAGFEIGKSAQLMLVRSRDDGLTWSKPENLTRKLKKEAWWLLAPAPQQGIHLAGGTMVMPMQGRDEKGVPFATIMWSRDHGATWTVGAPAFSGGNECQAALLNDGSIMLNMRNDHERFRAVYVTSDLGKTWKPHPTNRNTLIEPNCNASLRRVNVRKGGESRPVLLFANPHSEKARTHHTIQASFDDGLTWPERNRLLLDEGRGRGYPSLSQIDADHVGIVYEGSQADIVFEKIALRDLVP
jgi:sialidase-1